MGYVCIYSDLWSLAYIVELFFSIRLHGDCIEYVNGKLWNHR